MQFVWQSTAKKETIFLDIVLKKNLWLIKIQYEEQACYVKCQKSI